MAGDIEVWAGQFARVDVVLEVQVCVGFDAAGSAHGGDASSEVETWGGKRQLRQNDWAFKVPLGVNVGPRDVVQVIVHADDAGHDGVATEIEHRDVRRSGYVGAFLDGGDLAGFDHDVPVVVGGGSGAVDGAYVGEDDFGRLDPHVFL